MGLQVFRMVRGLAVGAVMLTGITACSGDGESAARGDSTASANASQKDERATGDDREAKAPIVLTQDQVCRALVDTESAPDGWEGFGAEIDVPEEALRTCRQDTGTKCEGFIALGSSFIRQSVSGGQVVFRIYAFGTPGDAQVAMKGLAAGERSKAGSRARPLEVRLDTDETDAFTGPQTMIVTRLGGTLVRVISEDLPQTVPYADLAKLQTARVRQTAAIEDVGP
ncbi:hypothetical protein OYE22_23400 [Streptomyces sp. 71268]|uniref:hypothetical protein n=1 Tax=Streptomyces sp. 71268 TaxID=3002640 RepID=UPI0023F96CBB|nr:hypothetical protein [Streptomyces sp. 71268]WEV27797.1 hypothetical protein OYE22_23400 [Streptomyces sp. 71268]